MSRFPLTTALCFCTLLFSSCVKTYLEPPIAEKPVKRPKPLPVETPIQDTLANQVAPPPAFSPPEIPTLPPPPQTDADKPSFRVARSTVRVLLSEIRGPLALGFSTEYIAYDAKGNKVTVQGNTLITVKGNEAHLASGYFLLPVIFMPAIREARFSFKNETYRGCAILRKSASGGPILINELPIEDYLKGVVPYEIGKRDTNAFEALKVQAIVARTYTYSRLGAKDSSGFDVYSDESDQVYNGTKGEYPLSNTAVDSTRDIVVLANDSLIQTFYYSTSSGRTANIEEVWPDRGYRSYLRSVEDSIYNLSSKHFFWTEEWDGPLLEKILNRSLSDMFRGYRGHGKLQNLVIESNTSCGRVKTLAVTMSGETYRVNGDKTRWLLRRKGAERPILRSACFTLEILRSGRTIKKIIAHGRGFGHGVGLSQVGTVGMALAGKKAEEIISAYYSGITLAKARY